jgi:DNA-binding PadR family transcriptional regulator
MPAQKPTRPALPSNDLILAAIERAICHRGRNEPESISDIKAHLDLPHNGWTTLQLRPKLTELEASGLIERSRHDRSDLWKLTAKGRTRLGAIRADITLPEAPQHQRWREAHTAAGERITGFRSDLRDALDRAIALLEADQETDSATWYELSDRLHQAGRKLASAIHCLREWPEPDDSQPDTDDPPYKQHGRRQIRGWDSDLSF